MADFEAGIGTLTRLGDSSVDAVLLVVEPAAKSLEVGARAAVVAREKSLGPLTVVANRISTEEELVRVQAAFPTAEVVPVPEDPAVLAADRRGQAPIDMAPDAPAVRALVNLAERFVAT